MLSGASYIQRKRGQEKYSGAVYKIGYNNNNNNNNNNNKSRRQGDYTVEPASANGQDYPQ